MGQLRRRLGKDHHTNRRVLDRFRSTCAICHDVPKTAALIFEKIVGPIETLADAPVEFTTFRGEQQTIRFPPVKGGGSQPQKREAGVRIAQGSIIGALPRTDFLGLLNANPNTLCAAVTGIGYRPVLCYSQPMEEVEAFKAGDFAFVLSCVRSLGVVDEESLSWEQVIEFRKDLEARALRTRFLFWLNEEMNGKSQAQIQDHLARLYEQHENALRKFGIYTKAVVESVLAVGDKSSAWSKTSLGAVLWGAGSEDPIWATLATGIHLARETWAGVTKAHAALRSEHDAMAFIQNLTKRFPPDVLQAT